MLRSKVTANSISSFLLAATLLWGSSGCSIRLHEKVASVSAGQGMSTLCLNGLQSFIGRYFDGKASTHEVESTWNCAIDALTLFQTQTRGSTPGGWKPNELREFLQRFFISDFKISDRLLEEAMVFKNSVIGGGTSEIRKSDLGQLVQILNVLKTETIRLQPFLPIQWKTVEKMTDGQISSLETTLIQSATNIGEALNTKWNAYTFSHFKAFIEEIGKIYPEQSLEMVTSRMDLLIALKRIFVSPLQVENELGEQVEGLQGSELVRLFTTLSKTAGIYLRYKKIAADGGILWIGTNRDRAVQLVRDGVGIVLDALAEYPFEVIPFAEILAVIKGVHDSEMKPFQRQTVEGLVVPVVQRFLGGPDFGLAGRKASGLSASGVRRFKAIIEAWFDVQVELEEGYTAALGKNLPVQILMGTPVPPRELVQIFKKGNGQTGGTEAGYAISQYLADDRQFPTLFISNRPEITFFPYLSEHRKTLYQMTMWNLFKTISTLMVEGWADEPGRAARTEKISKAEFDNLVRDIGPPLLDLKIVDPTINLLHLASKRFREANLFTFSGNGDGYFDLAEGIQYMAILMSGMNLATKIYADLQSKCMLPELDVYDRNFLKESCVRTNLFDPLNLENYTQNMGFGPSYYTQLTGDRAKTFARALEASGRQDDGTGERMGSYVAEGTGTTLQYVEVMFSTYDKNRDGYIDHTDPEGGEAFLSFKGTLEGFAPQLKSEKQVEALFTYLLNTGHIPDSNECGKTTFKGTLDFIGWMIKRKHHFRADRLRVLEVFEEIAKQVAKGADPALVKKCADKEKKKKKQEA